MLKLTYLFLKNKYILISTNKDKIMTQRSENTHFIA